MTPATLIEWADAYVAAEARLQKARAGLHSPNMSPEERDASNLEVVDARYQHTLLRDMVEADMLSIAHAVREWRDQGAT